LFIFVFLFILFIVYHLWWNKDVYKLRQCITQWKYRAAGDSWRIIATAPLTSLLIFAAPSIPWPTHFLKSKFRLRHLLMMTLPRETNGILVDFDFSTHVRTVSYCYTRLFSLHAVSGLITQKWPTSRRIWFGLIRNMFTGHICLHFHTSFSEDNLTRH